MVKFTMWTEIKRVITQLTTRVVIFELTDLEAVISRTLRKETIKPTTATETAITSVTRAVCAVKLEQ